MALKYKVGDRVRIKSIDWYNENKDSNGNVVFSSKVTHFSWCENVRTVFTKDMVKFCGKVVTIETVWTANYSIVEGTNRDYFTDEMIEGLVKEETKVGTALNPIEPKSNANCLIMERVDELVKEENEKKLSDESWRYKNIFDSSQYPQSFECPEGYIFKDENGNVINATKIVLEKKKNEYPKTYEECCKVLGVNPDNFLSIRNLYQDDGDEESTDYERDLLGKFDSLWELLICRDAYWKIAGEEMGLGKPWKPDWIDGEWKWCVCYSNNNIEFDSYKSIHHTFSFPTKEMRDAFYENFKELINSCKELL